MKPRSEYQEQCTVFKWAKLNEYRYPCLKLLFGSMMGLKTPYAQLNKAKKAGMKAGKPDINLPVGRGGYCGLWIELKRKKGGKLTPAQDNMLKLLADHGNYVHVCRGADAAIRVIETYLMMDKNEEE